MFLIGVFEIHYQVFNLKNKLKILSRILLIPLIFLKKYIKNTCIFSVWKKMVSYFKNTTKL